MKRSVTPKPVKVLIVEDTEFKYADIVEVLDDHFGERLDLTRAPSVVSALTYVHECDWNLLILDVSMDIISNVSSRPRESHASLGGMDVLEEMYLTEKETPTIIITGFDYFVSSNFESEYRQAQTIQEIERKAREWFGALLIGCIRYGPPTWRDELSQLLKDET